LEREALINILRKLEGALKYAFLCFLLDELTSKELGEHACNPNSEGFYTSIKFHGGTELHG
jgi:hypothetical protein